MTNIRMVPGTAKSVASLALAQMRSGQMTINEARLAINKSLRELYRGERAMWAQRGRLPSVSSFEHSVALGVYMVETFALRIEDGTFNLADEVKAILDRSTTGRHELWFSREDGSAFISFEDHDDAVMFELALVGDRT